MGKTVYSDAGTPFTESSARPNTAKSSEAVWKEDRAGEESESIYSSYLNMLGRLQRQQPSIANMRAHSHEHQKCCAPGAPLSLEEICAHYPQAFHSVVQKLTIMS